MTLMSKRLVFTHQTLSKIGIMLRFVVSLLDNHFKKELLISKKEEYSARLRTVKIEGIDLS
jgi:hypothetical protein